jgi:hypothetical protein
VTHCPIPQGSLVTLRAGSGRSRRTAARRPPAVPPPPGWHRGRGGGGSGRHGRSGRGGWRADWLGAARERVGAAAGLRCASLRQKARGVVSLAGYVYGVAVRALCAIALCVPRAAHAPVRPAVPLTAGSAPPAATSAAMAAAAAELPPVLSGLAVGKPFASELAHICTCSCVGPPVHLRRPRHPAPGSTPCSALPASHPLHNDLSEAHCQPLAAPALAT